MAADPILSSWDHETLERMRTAAIRAFIQKRADEGGQRYREILATTSSAVIDLFERTTDLLTLESGEALASEPQLLDSARYLGGPPVSADDLDTLAETRVSARKTLNRELARKAAMVVRAWLDRDRFPWLFENPPRRPSAVERETAIRWTAGLMAVQRIQTERRTEAAARQQETVRALLRTLGYREVPVHDVNVVGDVGRREFLHGEALVAATKCDVPVGLPTGRLLLIECKVSNSATNSVKRLNREVGGKAAHWREAFGRQAYTAAVLAGVYKLKNLEDAQNAGVGIFWEHDLSQLADFLISTP